MPSRRKFLTRKVLENAASMKPTASDPMLSGQAQRLRVTRREFLVESGGIAVSASLLAAACTDLRDLPLAPESQAMSVDSVTTIVLAVHRFGVGGPTTTLVSSGIPLPPGALNAADLGTVQVWVGPNAQSLTEKAIYIEALDLKSHRTLGGLRSIYVQFEHSLTNGSPAYGELRFGPGLSRSLPDRTKVAPQFVPMAATDPNQGLTHTVARALPIGMALPTDPAYLCSTEFIAKLIPQTSWPATAPYADYFSRWQMDNAETRGEPWHWSHFPGFQPLDHFVLSNYYDRGMIYLQFWCMDGNPVWFQRAMYEIEGYCEHYQVGGPGGANSWGANQAYNQQPEGVLFRYLLTGDAQRRANLGLWAENFRTAWAADANPVIGDNTNEFFDGRSAMRCLVAHLCAWRVRAPANGQQASSTDWDTVVERDLNLMFGSLEPPGIQNTSTGEIPSPNWCNQHHAWMSAHLGRAWIRYYEWYSADARIPTRIRLLNNLHWNNYWMPNTHPNGLIACTANWTGTSWQHMLYHASDCSCGVPPGDVGNVYRHPAYTLNNFFSLLYFWDYAVTGDATQLTRGEVVFAGDLSDAPPDRVGWGINLSYNFFSAKELNDHYIGSASVASYRLGMGGPPTIQVTDNFNRPNNPDLGSAWDVTAGAGSLQIMSNAIRVGLPDTDTFETNNSVVWPNDQYSQLTLVSGLGTGAGNDGGIGPAVRCSTSAFTCYFVSGGENESRLYRTVNSNLTQLAAGTPFVNGDVVRLEVQGTTLRVYVNGGLRMGPFTDSQIASGRAGILAYNISGEPVRVADNWEGGEL